MLKYHDAMRVAVRMNERDMIEATFAACADPLEKKQLCYLLARQGVTLDLEEGTAAVRQRWECLCLLWRGLFGGHANFVACSPFQLLVFVCGRDALQDFTGSLVPLLCFL